MRGLQKITIEMSFSWILFAAIFLYIADEGPHLHKENGLVVFI